MLPLIDSYIQNVIIEKLQFLKEHPEFIEKFFGRLATKRTLHNLTEYITKKDFNVILGYPRDVQSLPCFVVTIAGEQEVSIGLGDNLSDLENDSIYSGDDLLKEYNLAQIYMNSTFRVECWSDNGDLTSYMYAMLKFCLLSSRHDMLSHGFVNISLTGTDLEPVPDYFPVFVYRRTLQITLSYENIFIEQEELLGEPPLQLPKDQEVDASTIKVNSYPEQDI